VTDETSKLRFHHVGIVVSNIAAAIEGFSRSLPASWDGCVYEDPLQKVKVAFLAARPGDTPIELVQPATDDSPVTRFLRERGGGLHHVCYEVASLEEQIAEMKSRGSLIARRPKPAVAFQGRRIAWMLTPERLLVELLERSRGDVGNQ
jgi:methylmalonyl-CoA/ethylmalonyl-CoA epimerase